MRWDQLFGDLTAQFNREHELEARDEMRDERRQRLRHIDLMGALHRLPDSSATLVVEWSSGRVSGVLESAGADWLSVRIDTSAGVSQFVLRSRCLRTLTGSLPRGRDDDSSQPWWGVVDDLSEFESAVSVASRVMFDALIADFSRRRKPCTIHAGTAEIHGTLDVVGEDWCVVSHHAPGRFRRDIAVVSQSVVLLSAIDAVTLDA